MNWGIMELGRNINKVVLVPFQWMRNSIWKGVHYCCLRGLRGNNAWIVLERGDSTSSEDMLMGLRFVACRCRATFIGVRGCWYCGGLGKVA